MSLINRTRIRDGRRAAITIERQWDASPTGTYSRTFARAGSYLNLGSYKVTKDCVRERIQLPKKQRKSKYTFVSKDPVTLNPFWCSDFDHVGGSGKVFTKKTAGLSFSLEGEVVATLYPNGVVLQPTDVRVDPRILDFVLAKAAAKRSQPRHDMAVTLGELRETVMMLANPLKSLIKLSRSCYNLGVSMRSIRFNGRKYIDYRSLPKKLRRMSAKKMLKNGREVVDDSTGLWLEYRYGVRPLLGEVDSILQLQADKVRSLDPLQTARSGYTLPTEKSVSRTSNAVHGFWFDFHITHEVRREVYCGMYYRNKLSGSGLGWLESMGLTPWNIPNLIWELTPCSFVVDRFVDVSSFLSNVVPKPHLVDLGNFVSVTKERIVLVHAVPTVHYSYGDKLYGKVDSLMWKQKTIERVTNLTLPVYPVWNPKALDLLTHLDHITLLWQRLPKWK